MLNIQTLGLFHVHLDGRLLDGSTDLKREMMLVYLAENPRPQPRKTVAQLLWPEVEVTVALSNLRSLLTRMRKEGLAPYLAADRHTLSLVAAEPVHYDARLLRTTLANLNKTDLTSLYDALQCYNGRFLKDIALPKQPELEEWALSVQRDLERLATLGLCRLTELALGAGSTDIAINTARRLLEMAPYDDEHNALFMRALTAGGRQALAVQHYEGYLRILNQNLDIRSPSPRLVRLASELRQFQAEKPAIAAISAQAPATPKPQERQPFLPRPISPLLNREHELAQLRAWVQHGDRRLITIVGLGGIGKTHLAIELGHSLQADFPDGVWLVDLAGEAGAQIGANTPTRYREYVQRLIHSIGQTLGIVFAGHLELDEQLLTALRLRKRCLILDNFETMASTAPFLMQILAAAPSITLIITSRSRLKLSAERVFTLKGLPIPDTENLSDLMDSGALQLLLENLSGFGGGTISPEAVYAAARISRLVDGHPLSLRMAASWAEHLTLVEIAEQIEYSQSFLNASSADIPSRQESVNRILEDTWERLSPNERVALAKMSIFAGSFRAVDAKSVAGTTIDHLRALTDHAQLNRSGQGSYRLHPLVRQFGRDKLAAMANEQGPLVPQILASHAAHYLDQLADASWSEAAGTAGEDAQHDIEMALGWHLTHDPMPVLEAIDNVVNYWFTIGYVAKTRYWLEKFLDRTSPNSLERAAVLLHLGTYAQQHHSFKRAESLIEEACRIYALREETPGLAVATKQMAWTIFGQIERRAEAEKWFLASVEQSRQIGDERLLAHALHALGFHYTWHGSHEADIYLDEAMRLAKACDDKALMVSIQSNQFQLAQIQGDRTTMRHLYGEIKERVKMTDTPQRAWEPYRVAEHALALGLLDDAESFAREAMAEFRSFESPLGIAHVKFCLATNSRLRGDLQKASARYRASLTAADELHQEGLYALGALGLAEVEIELGHVSDAAILLGRVERIKDQLPSNVLPSYQSIDDRRQATGARQLLGDERFDHYRQLGYKQGQRKCIRP